ncbi:GNAT family N-acetyltransferase [Caldibacillus sp. 210928-DFI.2.22]|uniref:GNAT family N-acetyltransferase n=1 Tax=unclassified Caldibacillus TaxID=2641266 RepID=UPI001D06C2BD|nr:MULTISPECIES: GNAT family N-acetyltransferase [unclassified Caldibacillus]MCB7068498.1 GNAT family N-acetyltransferase [Caldibacillus sp. 210928-DFI.2.22]MCB7071813.1 GNAT family N-acetyltransferase [Caldibacillus sp. 210928-DFI.2.18]
MERAVDGNPWIGLIMIHNQYQSQGYGSEFLKSFLCWAQHQGWNEIRAAFINDRALKFLNDFGFNRYAVKEKRMPSGEKNLTYLQILLNK